MPHDSDRDTSQFEKALARLSQLSVDNYYNPYRKFSWPATLPDDMWWMTPELMTIHDSGLAEDFDQDQLFRLSRYESINFYSLNVHGIRELIVEVIKRIHTRGFESSSEFFHHFIGEENEHMWFFAEFCLRYGGKIYKQPSFVGDGHPVAAAEDFLVFARILIFEELVDHFNTKMANDQRLNDTIRQVNSIHHQDESRHIAFGRKLLAVLYEDLKEHISDDERRGIEAYLKRYLRHSFESLFNPRVYRDAGLADPLAIRSRLLTGPGRDAFERSILRKPVRHLIRLGILGDDYLGADDPTKKVGALQ